MCTTSGENAEHNLTDWGCLSQHRGALMGVAILFIVLFHVSRPQGSSWYGLCRMGNVGVDIFLFLSGIGLWFAWDKKQSLSYYFRRRYSRIYPTWLIVASAFYIWQYPSHRYSRDIIDLCGDILINWDFWLHDELTFWYVPAIMVLYTVAPLFLMAIRKDRNWAWTVVLMMLWCCAVEWVTPIHQAVGHIEIFWSRVPIFFIGIACGNMVKSKCCISGSTFWLLIVMAVASLLMSWWLEQYRHGQFPLFVERMIYIPLTVSGCLLMATAMTKMPQRLLGLLSYVGGLSLEIYLIHSNFFLTLARPLRLGYWMTAIVVLACSIPTAWLLQRIRSMIKI